tara:strand:- start:520 stop:945 length:426 start_codon:yes stop_codon:yes gene_type:complete
MTPLSAVREIPRSDRYFEIDLGDDLGAFDFRFPSYGVAARLVGLLQGLEQGDGLDKLVGLLDVAGYCVGACWFNRGYALDAGPAPAIAEGDAWRGYGDGVVDELQEYGVKLPGIMALVNGLIEELAARLGETGEVETIAKN